jgi:cytosine deaminase
MNLLVRNARLRGRDQLVDIGIEQGRIAAVASDLAASAGQTIDAAGDLVVPGFVNLHLHADKALLGEVMRPNVSGTLPEAIEITNDFKRKYDPQEVAPGA